MEDQECKCTYTHTISYINQSPYFCKVFEHKKAAGKTCLGNSGLIRPNNIFFTWLEQVGTNAVIFCLHTPVRL